MAYFLYLLECSDKTIYTGITTDIDRRLREHQEGKLGAKYTRAHGAVRIIYSEKFTTRSAALKREAEVKKWSRKKKLGLVK
jgi:putative endonuclease